ncbi:MAG: S8 family serine peptidase [Microbacteriaceae bacterium]
MRGAVRGCGFAVVAVVVLLLAGVAAPARADQARSLEYWLSDYGVSAAWETTRGAGVTVAVIDTGVDGRTAELAGSVTGGTDVSGIGAPDGQQPIGPESAHGTWVASLLAGRGTGDGEGVIGVAPGASILSISTAFGSTASTVSADDQIADAVRWAVDHGATVINMSLTRNTLAWPQSWDAVFQYAFEHDVVIVAAAGNRGSGTAEVGAPATIPGVLTVAGVDRSGVASFDASSQGITIGVSAPSEELVGANPGGGYVTWRGTSGATPLVAGVVALVRAAYPGLDAANVINRVIATARPVPGAGAGAGPSPVYGYGLVDAAAAVNATVAPVTTNPMGDLGAWIRLHRRAAATPEPSSAPKASVPKPSTVPPEAVDVLGMLTAYDRRFAMAAGIPVILLAGCVAVVALGAAGARGHFRRAHRR